MKKIEWLPIVISPCERFDKSKDILRQGEEISPETQNWLELHKLQCPECREQTENPEGGKKN